VAAVTLVDYFYITLAIMGVGKLLENNKFKKIFWIISSIVLILFWILMIRSIILWGIQNIWSDITSLSKSFVSVFLLTISNPMTIVFFTGLFTAKAIEYHYKKKELLIFGLSTGLATLLFMWASVVLFSLIKQSIPALLIQILNLLVGWLLIVYGSIRLIKIISPKQHI
jgi:threonine/homoserine/homoserine lactone efflux protein